MPVADALGVAGDVAHRGVHLAESQAHDVSFAGTFKPPGEDVVSLRPGSGRGMVRDCHGRIVCSSREVVPDGRRGLAGGVPARLRFASRRRSATPRSTHVPPARPRCDPRPRGGQRGNAGGGPSSRFWIARPGWSGEARWAQRTWRSIRADQPVAVRQTSKSIVVEALFAAVIRVIGDGDQEEPSKVLDASRTAGTGMCTSSSQRVSARMTAKGKT